MAQDPSVFDLSFQHDDVDAKIIASLERLSTIFRGLLWEKAKEHDLTPLQVQVLVYLRYHPPGEGRVGELARRFDLAAATVSDAVGTLVEKGLVAKEPDPSDRRARVLTLTDDGAATAENLGDWAGAVREALSSVPDEEKAVVMETLMDLIASLEQRGVITVARMCRTCRFFGEDEHDGCLLFVPERADLLRGGRPRRPPKRRGYGLGRAKWCTRSSSCTPPDRWGSGLRGLF